MTTTIEETRKQLQDERVKELTTVQTKPRHLFSVGKNKKFGYNVAILNLPPILTCPNCATCAGTCYANFRYGNPSVKNKWDWNWEMTKQDNFVELATNELRFLGVPIVRFHESGDFYSDEYIDKCLELAIANPQIKFYGYTKVKNALKLNVLANVNIIYSFVETPIGEVRNYGSEDLCNLLHDNYGTEICELDESKGEKCMINCTKCLHCTGVCFKIHGRDKKKDKYSQPTIEKLKEVRGD